jgi:hypothetical protein
MTFIVACEHVFLTGARMESPERLVVTFRIERWLVGWDDGC